MNPIQADLPATQTSAHEDQRLVQIVEEYRALLEAGKKPDRQPFLERYPDLAANLNDCFDGLEFVFTVAPDVREVHDKKTSAISPLSTAVPLGDYKVIREIGRGGMGVVYEAEQMLLGRRVALKVLPFAATMDARQLQRFQNEARAAACLHHPHIVPVYAVGCERGVHFYAMQFIEGQSLAGVISDLRKPDVLREPDAPARGAGNASTLNNLKASTHLSARSPQYFKSIARLGIQAGQALHHAHEVGVIHRDVKPANLMLDGNANLWITDFGLAQIQGDAQLTMTGDLIGTLRYMSPEQALAKRVIIDHRTDIYSLGATLYELLTQQPVFPGGDRQELLRQIAFEEPLALRRHNKAIPAELETIVLKALEKNPADRYASAQELADDLERFGKDEPIKARRPTMVSLVRKWCRRHQSLVWSATAALILVALVLAGSIGWVAQERAARQKDMDRQRAATEQAVDADLREAEIWWEQKKWTKAVPALERATGRLVGSGLESLQARVKTLRRDAALVVRLELASQQGRSLPQNYVNGTLPDFDKAYLSAFAENGLDVTALTLEESTRRIRASAIRVHLVAALDNWANCKDNMVSLGLIRQEESGDSLRAIAQLVDDDDWRKKLRDPRIFKDRLALERLAEDDAVLYQRPENVMILFHLLDAATNNGSGTTNGVPLNTQNLGVQMLLRAQKIHPADFWININLGYHLPDDPESGAEAIGFCRAAVALQPENPISYITLAQRFGKQEKFLEEEITWRKAIEVEPDQARGHRNLGSFLAKQHKWPEAAAAFRKAIELQPDNARLYTYLGVALSEQEKYLKAIEVFRRAIGRNLPISKDLYYNAARAAALAGCGKGDAANLDAKNRAGLRGEALAWLRVVLATIRKSLETESNKAGPEIVKYMQHWQKNTDFDGVRGEEALSNRPEAERREWQALWDDVAALEKQAADAR